MVDQENPVLVNATQAAVKFFRLQGDARNTQYLGTLSPDERRSASANPREVKPGTILTFESFDPEVAIDAFKVPEADDILHYIKPIGELLNPWTGIQPTQAPPTLVNKTGAALKVYQLGKDGSRSRFLRILSVEESAPASTGETEIGPGAVLFFESFNPNLTMDAYTVPSANGAPHTYVIRGLGQVAETWPLNTSRQPNPTLLNATGAAIKVYQLSNDGVQTRYLRTVSADEALPASKIPFEIGPGAVLFFESFDANQPIDAYKVASTENNAAPLFTVKPLRMPVNLLANKYRSAPSFESVLSGFHILFIDPLNIDGVQAGTPGKRSAIFERLSPEGRDYEIQDGELYHKQGFGYTALDSSWGERQTTFHKSVRSFKETLAVNIGVGLEFGDASASRSAGYREMTEQKTTKTSLYSVSRQETSKYAIDVLFGEAKFDSDFISAVKNLPFQTTVASPSDFSQAVFDELTNFEEEYGTHCCTRMTFGGYYMRLTSMTSHQEEINTSKGFNFAQEASVPVKGATVSASGSFDYSTAEGYSDVLETTVDKYVYKGGDGGFDGWTVSDDSQAIGLDLKPIYEILVPEYISEDVIGTAELSRMRENLRIFTSRHAKAIARQNTREYQVRFHSFKIEKNNDPNDYSKGIYGIISAIPSAKLAAKRVAGPEVFFDRSSAAGSRVNVGEGSTFYGSVDKSKVRNYSQVYKMSNSEFETMAETETIALRGFLKDHDDASKNDNFGDQTITVKLRDFTDIAFQPKIHEVTLKSGSDRIAKVRFQTLWTNGFDVFG